MGWWIALGIITFLVFLVLLPFCIPIRIRASWKGGRDFSYSLHYGPVPVLPDGMDGVRAWWQQQLDRMEPVFRIIRPIWKGITWLVLGILWLLKQLLNIITWPIRKLRSRKRPPKAKPDTDRSGEEDNLDIWSGPPEEDEEELWEEQEQSDQPEEEFTEEPETFFEDLIEEPRIELPPPEEEQWEEETGIEEEEEEEPVEKRGPFEQLIESLKQTFSSFGTKGKKISEKLEKIQETVSEAKVYLEIWNKHKRTILKFLRLLLKLGGAFFRCFRFKTLYVRVTSGGEPTALGMAFGWQQAFLGAIDTRLPSHIQFVPDFYDDTFDPQGEAELDARLWLILIILPTLAFLLQLPYLGFWRAYKDYKNISGDSADE